MTNLGIELFSQLKNKYGHGSYLNDQAILLQKILLKGGQGNCLNDQAKLLQKTLFKGGLGSCINEQAKMFHNFENLVKIVFKFF